MRLASSYASPIHLVTPHLSPDNTSSPLRSLARETAAVAAGRIIGYRRLSSVL